MNIRIDEINVLLNDVTFVFPISGFGVISMQEVTFCEEPIISCYIPIEELDRFKQEWEKSKFEFTSIGCSNIEEKKLFNDDFKTDKNIQNTYGWYRKFEKKRF